MTEQLPPWVIRKNGALLGAFGWVGTHRPSAVSFHSKTEAEDWTRANPIARGAEVVNSPYEPPALQNAPANAASDYEPSEADNG